MHLSLRLTKGVCEGQEVKQSEANAERGPQLRLDEKSEFISLLRNRQQESAGDKPSDQTPFFKEIA
jgi:hypothetical protein